MRFSTCLVLMAAFSSSAFACGEGGLEMVAEDAPELKVFAALEPITVSKPFNLELSLCGNETTGSVDADAWMPRHKHGMNYAPVVAPNGNGKYMVTNMVFHMPGLWQVRVNVSDAADAKPTTYVLDVQVK